MKRRTYLLGGVALTFVFPDVNDLCPHTGQPLDPRPRPTPPVFAPDARLEPVETWGGGSQEHFAMRRQARGER